MCDDMGSHNKELFRLSLWDELMQSISFAKDLSVAYHLSVKNQKCDSNELLNALKTSNAQSHDILDKIIECSISPQHADEHNAPFNDETHMQVPLENTAMSVPYQRRSNSRDSQLMITPNEYVTENPRYRSRSPSQVRIVSSEIERRSNTRIRYQPETKYRSHNSQYRNLNRSPSNSYTSPQSRNPNRSPSYSYNSGQFRNSKRSPTNFHTSTQSQQLDCSSYNYHNPGQYTVNNRSRSKSQGQLEFDSRNMHSSESKHRPPYRKHSRSPSNKRFRTRYRSRNRSRSRSYHEKRYDSKTSNSSKKKYQPAQSRMKKKLRSKSLSKSKSKSPSRKEKLTKDQPLPKPNNQPTSNPPETSEVPKKQRAKRWRKSKNIQEPEDDSGIMMLPPPQDAFQGPRPYFHHNPLNGTAAIYFAQPTLMPRLIRPPYYMPPRPPHLPYPPSYPRLYLP